jgi:hypothetical protein
MADFSEPIPKYPGAASGNYIEDQPAGSSDLYLRKWTLSLGQSGIAPTPQGQPGELFGGVADPNGVMGGQHLIITTEEKGMDFRMTFKVRHADADHPGTAEIRIYNLSDETAAGVIRDYNTVVLQAGYIHGRYGVIFAGTIKQYKRGRESAIDSYLDLYCADGDAGWNQSFQMRGFRAGETDGEKQRKYAEDHAKASGGSVGTLQAGTIGGVKTARRGGVDWGATSDLMREHGRTTGSSWSMQHGKIQNIANTSYAPGDIVLINVETGMIGVPEQTQEGIAVTTLLNPNYFIKQRVELNNKDINQMYLPGQSAPGDGHTFTGAAYGQYKFHPEYYASTANDGRYVIIMIDHDGDTRGLPWYSHLTCLNIDPSDPFGLKSVPAGGGAGVPPDSAG